MLIIIIPTVLHSSPFSFHLRLCCATFCLPFPFFLLLKTHLLFLFPFDDIRSIGTNERAHTHIVTMNKQHFQTPSTAVCPHCNPLSIISSFFFSFEQREYRVFIGMTYKLCDKLPPPHSSRFGGGRMSCVRVWVWVWMNDKNSRGKVSRKDNNEEWKNGKIRKQNNQIFVGKRLEIGWKEQCCVFFYFLQVSQLCSGIWKQSIV